MVTAHAVTVPVTPHLSSEDAGFLPIHCMHQLLRSRAFTKHAVPVKVRIPQGIMMSSVVVVVSLLVLFLKLFREN